MTTHRKNGKIITGIILTALIVLVLMSCAKKEPAVEIPKQIPWVYDIGEGLAAAEAQGKPVLVDFMATWCPPCKAMEDSTFSNLEVLAKITSFIPVRIDVDEQEEIANKYNGNAAKYGGVGIPNMLFMTADETKLKHVVGFRGPKKFVALMDSVLSML